MTAGFVVSETRQSDGLGVAKQRAQAAEMIHGMA